MKKAFNLILCLALIFSLGTAALAADTDFVRSADITYRGISIVVNDKKIVPQDASGNAVEPFIMDGTTYLPVRAIAGALGLDVSWDGASSTVVLKSGSPLNYGSGSALASYSTERVDITFRDIKITLDGYELIPTNAAGEVVEPFILNGTTYLPVRGIANALGADVEWDASTSTVRLTAAAGEEEDIDDSVYVLVKATQTTTNENGEVSSVETTTYDYYPNGLERTIVKEDDSGIQLKFTSYYSDDGLLTRTESQGEYNNNVVTYSYDANGQLIREVSTGDSSYINDYSYDPDGLHVHIVSTGDFGYVNDHAYNSDGDLISYKTVYSDGRVGEGSYTYNSLGQEIRRDITYPEGDRVITTFDYDAEGCLIKETTSVTFTSSDYFSTSVTAYAYEPAPQGDGWLLVSSVDDGFGVSKKYTYNSDGLIIAEYSYYEGELTDLIEYEYDSYQNLICYTYHSYWTDRGYSAMTTYEYLPVSAFS